MIIFSSENRKAYWPGKQFSSPTNYFDIWGIPASAEGTNQLN